MSGPCAREPSPRSGPDRRARRPARSTPSTDTHPLSAPRSPPRVTRHSPPEVRAEPATQSSRGKGKDAMQARPGNNLRSPARRPFRCRGGARSYGRARRAPRPRGQRGLALRSHCRRCFARARRSPTSYDVRFIRCEHFDRGLPWIGAELPARRRVDPGYTFCVHRWAMLASAMSVLVAAFLWATVSRMLTRESTPNRRSRSTRTITAR